jgi:hypothetical protein
VTASTRSCHLTYALIITCLRINCRCGRRRGFLERRSRLNAVLQKLSLKKTSARLPHSKRSHICLGLAGDTKLVVWSFFAERANRKELVAARDAPVGRHAEEALERSGKAGYMFGSDALEIVIAANGAMRGKFAGNRNEAGTEARAAARASPRQAADESGGEIQEIASARTATAWRSAGGANHHSWVFLWAALGLREIVVKCGPGGKVLLSWVEWPKVETH